MPAGCLVRASTGARARMKSSPTSRNSMPRWATVVPTCNCVSRSTLTDCFQMAGMSLQGNEGGTAILGCPLSSRSVTANALKPGAFLMLLLLATMFGANHVAARVALDHGVDVLTAVAVRSGTTALVVAVVARWLHANWSMKPRERRVMLVIGVLVSLQ